MSMIWLIGALFTMSYLDTGFWNSIGCLFYWPVLLGEHFRRKEK